MCQCQNSLLYVSVSTNCSMSVSTLTALCQCQHSPSAAFSGACSGLCVLGTLRSVQCLLRTRVSHASYLAFPLFYPAFLLLRPSQPVGSTTWGASSNTRLPTVSMSLEMAWNHRHSVCQNRYVWPAQACTHSTWRSRSRLKVPFECRNVRSCLATRPFSSERRTARARWRRDPTREANGKLEGITRVRPRCVDHTRKSID